MDDHTNDDHGHPLNNQEPYYIQRMMGRRLFGQRLMRRYGDGVATDTVYDVGVVNPDWADVPMTELNEELSEMWQDVISHVITDGALPSDLIRIHIDHKELEHGEIKVPLQKVSDITPEAIMNHISTVMQSHKAMSVDGLTEISVGVIKLPRAQGRTKHLSVSNKDLKHYKRSVIVIDNSDTLCLPRSLAVCCGWAEKQANILTRAMWRDLCNKDKPCQTEEALEMIGAIGLHPAQCSNMANIPLYEKYLEANIVVVSAAHQNKIIHPKT